MQKLPQADQADPLLRYLAESFHGSAPRLPRSKTCPIAVPKAPRDSPYAPWTASGLSQRNTIAGGSLIWSNPKDISLIQSHEDAQWTLDEIQESLFRLQPNRTRRRSTEFRDIADQGQKAGSSSQKPIGGHSSWPPRNPRLNYPVILPQRRPKWPPRGLIKAYAPALNTHGVSESTFLNFLEAFDEDDDLQRRYISAVNLASEGVSSPDKADWPMLVAIDMSASANAAETSQPRSKMDEALATANTELFRPRGLYCLATSYMPDSAPGHHRVDVLSPAALHSSYRSAPRRVRTATPRSRGSTFRAEAAPLVFPGLDALRDRPAELAAATRDQPARAQQLVQDYYSYSRDRARLERSHGARRGGLFSERSQQTLMSRYAHPRDVATTGSFVSLASGQYVKVPPMARPASEVIRGAFASQRRMGEEDDDEVFPSEIDEAVRRTADLSMSRGLSGDQPQQGGVNAPDRSRRLTMTTLKKNIVYFMIVNMPSDEELAVAMREVERQQRDGTKHRRVQAPL